MERAEFERLRDLPGKVIAADVKFAADEAHHAGTVRFRDISVENTGGWQLVVDGAYTAATGKIVYNFRVRGVGPVCRVEVNGAVHPGAGRNHKHDLRSADCPRMNPPTALRREDLAGLDSRSAWARICSDARIEHRGRFMAPEEATDDLV